MARLIVAEEGRKRAVTLVGELITIGSGAEANLKIRDPEVTSSHCQIASSSGKFILTPASGNAVYLNGKLVQHPEILRHADQMRIGNVTLMFEAQAPQAAAPPPPPPLAPPRPSHRRERERTPRDALPIGPILAGSLVLIAIMGAIYWVANMASGGLAAEDKLVQARSLIEQKRVEEATLLLQSIDASAGKAYDDAQSLLRKNARSREAHEERLQPPDPISVYEQIITPYYQQHLKQAADEADRARAYYFLEWRCKEFTKRFPQSTKDSALNRMKEYFRDTVRSVRSFPETLRDVNVVVEGENELNHFGESYKTVNDWLLAHGNSEDAGEAKKLRDQCLESARKYAGKEIEVARRRIQEQYFVTARRMLEDAKANCSGVPGVVEEIGVELTRLEAAENRK